MCVLIRLTAIRARKRKWSLLALVRHVTLCICHLSKCTVCVNHQCVCLSSVVKKTIHDDWKWSCDVINRNVLKQTSVQCRCHTCKGFNDCCGYCHILNTIKLMILSVTHSSRGVTRLTVFISRTSMDSLWRPELAYIVKVHLGTRRIYWMSFAQWFHGGM